MKWQIVFDCWNFGLLFQSKYLLYIPWKKLCIDYFFDIFFREKENYWEK